MAGRSIIAAIKVKPRSNSTGFTVEKLEAALEKGYLLSARESKFTTKKSFAPSSIGYEKGTCPRYWHIAFSGADFIESPEAFGVAVMGAGTASHDRIQKALEKAGVVVELEAKAELQDPPVFGYIDLILEIDGEKVVGEIKTTGADIFRYRMTSHKPAPYHLYQILLYMRITGLDKGFLMYEDRDSLQICVMEISMDEKNAKVLDDALDWMRTVYNNWKDGGEIAAAPWTKRNKACRHCPVFNDCWDEEKYPKGEKTIPAMEVYKP